LYSGNKGSFEIALTLCPLTAGNPSYSVQRSTSSAGPRQSLSSTCVISGSSAERSSSTPLTSTSPPLPQADKQEGRYLRREREKKDALMPLLGPLLVARSGVTKQGGDEDERKERKRLPYLRYTIPRERTPRQTWARRRSISRGGPFRRARDAPFLFTRQSR